jgi:signal transduction histidine kinase
VDSARLELVILNLVSNAIKYCDPDKFDRWVEIAADRNETGCTLSVRDNGLGIPDSDQAAIFDRFFRAHSHLDGELGVSGTGLGLAIVVECVRELGASIACHSTPGEGSTFVVQLPGRPAVASPTPDTGDA